MHIVALRNGKSMNACSDVISITVTPPIYRMKIVPFFCNYAEWIYVLLDVVHKNSNKFDSFKDRFVFSRCFIIYGHFSAKLILGITFGIEICSEEFL